MIPPSISEFLFITSAKTPIPSPAFSPIFTASRVKLFTPSTFVNVSDVVAAAVIFAVVSKRALPILSELVAPTDTVTDWLEYAPTWNSLFVKEPASSD